jgi:signal transduction histidine kinase
MDVLKQLIFDSKYWWLRHLMFWLFLYVDVFSYIWDYQADYQSELISDILSLLLDMALVYFNLYVLIPKFALNNKLVQYLFYSLLTLLFVCSINTYEDFYLFENEEHFSLGWSFYYTVLATVGVLAPAVAIKISKYFYQETVRANEVEKIGLKSELNYLKQQINPHFLFNSLNNIYIMSREKSSKTPDTILQLSDLMRYQTYEAAKDKVLLSKEIEFLDNYLKLEQLRRDNLAVEYNVKGQTNRLLIDPLLFLPFVENACKYSCKTDGSKEEIHMNWSINDNHLQFNIVNNIGVARPNDKEHSGFGLDNVKKRLELLYPNKHRLSIIENGDNFSVDLIIEF